MQAFLFIVLIVVAGYLWYQLEQLKRYTRQLETEVYQWRNMPAPQAVVAKPQTSNVTETALIYQVNSIAKSLDGALAQLPKIEETDEMFSSMSPKLRKELSFSIAPEFQQGMAQLTGQKLEAISKLAEITQRFVLYLKTVQLAAWTVPAGVEAELAVIAQVLEIDERYGEKLSANPAYRAFADAVLGKAIARLINESKLTGGLVSPNDMMKVLIASRDNPMLTAEKVLEQINLDEDEVDDATLDREVLELRTYYESRYPKPTTNGHKSNGRYSEGQHG